MVETITTEEWQAALRAAYQRPDDEGWTTREIGDAVGMSQQCVRRFLVESIGSGLWEHAGHRNSVSIDGRRTQSPVYRQVQKD